MTGSAATTRSPSRRTTSRSVPCVAGCCGPMLSTMSPVSSSTFICASARWRNIGGSTSTSGSSPGGGRSVRGHRRTSIGRRRLVVAVAGLHPASARRRRDPATASLRARATGSPCAADGLRTRTADRGDAGSGWPSNTMPYISHASRSCQSAPGYTDTHDSACGSSSSTSVFKDDAPSAGGASTRRSRTPGSGPRSRRRRRSSPSAAPARDVSPEPSSATAGVGIQSIAGRRTRGSRSRAAPCRTARRGATRRAAPARRRRRTSAPCSTIASPSSACEARAERVSRAPVSTIATGASGSLGLGIGRSAGASGRRQPTTIGSRCVPFHRSAGSSF